MKGLEEVPLKIVPIHYKTSSPGRRNVLPQRAQKNTENEKSKTAGSKKPANSNQKPKPHQGVPKRNSNTPQIRNIKKQLAQKKGNTNQKPKLHKGVPKRSNPTLLLLTGLIGFGVQRSADRSGTAAGGS
jgi:hypothetical protein